MKLKKLISKHLGLALLALAVVFIATGVVAQQGGLIIQNVEQFVYSGTESLGTASPLTVATEFTDLKVTNDLEVDQELQVDATSTLQELTFGSRFADAIAPTAGSTTTPGGLFSLQNTGAPKICSMVELDITAIGPSFQFAIGTSTQASAWSTKTATLVASSTVPTDTTALLNFVDQVGVSAMDSFLWGAGEYILGAFDLGNRNNASSSDYVSRLTGSAYVTCHTR